MKTKKQIDRLFRERFKDFESVPPESVWQDIATQLHPEEKKKRRAVPFWYKAAGVAAGLLVFLAVGSLFINPKDLAPELITDNENEKKQHSPAPDQEIPEQTHVVSTEEKTPDNAEEGPSEAQTSETKPSNNTIVSTTSALPDPEKEQEQTSPSKKGRASDATAVTASTESKKPENNQDTKEPITRENSSPTTEQGIAGHSDAEKNTSQEKEKHISSEKDREAIAAEETDKESEKETSKKSLLEYVKEKEEKEDAVVLEEGPSNRWDIYPTVAPVYYSSFGNGSSIDSQFSDNPKSGDVNFSYGVQVSYAFSDKLSVRTGINKVALSYVTEGIEFAASDPNAALKNIDYSNPDVIVAVGNQGTLAPPPSHVPTVTEDGQVITPRNGIISGTMSQQLDYLEVPLELKYDLLDTRFGIQMIGGMSTLVLNNNEIRVQSSGFENTIGSANNLNDLSFSTNLGVGFHYKLSQKFLFNMEPMFKYQLNPYSGRSDFKPYYLGVYSGFSWKF